MSKLTDEQIDGVYRDVWSTVTHSKRLIAFARAIEAAATEPLLQRIAEFVTALDEEMVVSHLGVFNPGDDPKKAIKDLMLWSQGVGEYFAGEKSKECIAELEQRNRDLYEDVQRFRKHALNEKAARMELERQLEEARKDAERWRTFLSTRPKATHDVINQAIDDAAMQKGKS